MFPKFVEDIGGIFEKYHNEHVIRDAKGHIRSSFTELMSTARMDLGGGAMSNVEILEFVDAEIRELIGAEAEKLISNIGKEQ